MRKQEVNQKEPIAPTLDDLLSDNRLARLFFNGETACALQLWVLQISSKQSVENRIIYGRLLPYSHSSECWSASDRNNFDTFGETKAQVVRLALYTKSARCAELLRQLSAGKTISTISEELEINLPNKLKERFGATAFAGDGLVYRPVAYLLNRDAYDRRSLSSPHGGAGAFSASITQTDKNSLFRVGQDYNVALTSSVIARLNADTGLDFGSTDTTRFGDLELLVFPALDERERPLLEVRFVDNPRTLITRFNPTQVPNFCGFQFRLSIANDEQVVYSSIVEATRGTDDVFECKFELSDQLRARIDSIDLEVFGFLDGAPRKATLCCRWQGRYLRELNFRGNVVGHAGSTAKFDWLERTTRSSESARVKAALTVNRGDPGFTNHIGGREADPWVPVNRDLVSLFTRLYPPVSEGRFFLRWGTSDGEGRLQFVEWFKALLAKYHQHQIVIFDPYFETAGLGLVLLYAAPKADCVVFTSLPKPSKEGNVMPEESDKITPDRINNLLAGCEQNRNTLKRIKLRIYGLKEGRLHDRYILVMGPDGLPAAGFNLSNSFQKAAENYPLLVTPIPADTLLRVEEYKSTLIKEAQTTQVNGETESSPMRLLFDSVRSPSTLTLQRGYEPLHFLEMNHSGDVLSLWTDEKSLEGLRGNSLKERMEALGLLKDGSLAPPAAADLSNYLDHYAGDFTNFTDLWLVLGEILAHSHADRFRQLEPDYGFIEFLTRFLETSFTRLHVELDNEWGVVDPQFFREPVEALLHSSHRVESLFYPVKYAALTWPEFFAIKLLWWLSPSALLAIAEAQLPHLPEEQPQCRDAVRLSLLSQIVSEVSLTIQFDISEAQIDLLVASKNGLLRWMGLRAIERQLEKSGGIGSALQFISAFSHPERVQALGWMINHAAKNPKETETYYGLVAALHDALPEAISAGELKQLIDSMRGHMQKLSWAEPWLFRDVIHPLLQDNRASISDTCKIWIEELVNLLGPEPKHQSRLFEREREGQTTNISAYLIAHCALEQRQSSLKLIQTILKKQQQTLQQPLASTSNWARWDDALVVSMWIFAFTRWSQFYLRTRDLTDQDLDDLSRRAGTLARIRPMIEWQSLGAGKQGELAAFLEQVEKLLAS